MKRNKVIVMTRGKDKEIWGRLTDLCKAHPDFSYSYLKGKAFPFIYKDIDFEKLEYKTVTIK